MRYTPKHAAPAPKASIAGKRTAGVLFLSAATVGTGLSLSPKAEAATPYNVWDRVAACESGGNWKINTGNGFYGGLQFTISSWRGAGGGAYASHPHYASREQQIKIGQNLLRMQGPGAWPVCSVRAGLTRSNGLAVVVGGGSGSTGSGGGTSRTAVRKLVVDGRFGPLTTRATQKWLKVPQTGYFDYRTRTALQRKVGVYPNGKIDLKTVAALQRYLNTKRTGASYLDYRTVNALQRFLNANVLR